MRVRRKPAAIAVAMHPALLFPPGREVAPGGMGDVFPSRFFTLVGNPPACSRWAATSKTTSKKNPPEGVLSRFVATRYGPMGPSGRQAPIAGMVQKAMGTNTSAALFFVPLRWRSESKGASQPYLHRLRSALRFLAFMACV